MSIHPSPNDLVNTLFPNAPQDGGGGDGRPSPDYSIPGLVGVPTLNAFGEWTLEYQRDPTFQLGGPGGSGGPPQFRPGELSLLQAQLAEQQRSNQAGEDLSGRQTTIARA